MAVKCFLEKLDTSIGHNHRPVSQDFDKQCTPYSVTLSAAKEAARNSSAVSFTTPIRPCPTPKHKRSHLRFLAWVALTRKSSLRIEDIRQRTCPLIGCETVLESADNMFRHVAQCTCLSRGLYRCFECETEELIGTYHVNGCREHQCIDRFATVANSLRRRFSASRPETESPIGVKRNDPYLPQESSSSFNATPFDHQKGFTNSLSHFSTIPELGSQGMIFESDSYELMELNADDGNILRSELSAETYSSGSIFSQNQLGYYNEKFNGTSQSPACEQNTGPVPRIPETSDHCQAQTISPTGSSTTVSTDAEYSPFQSSFSSQTTDISSLDSLPMYNGYREHNIFQFQPSNKSPTMDLSSPSLMSVRSNHVPHNPHIWNGSLGETEDQPIDCSYVTASSKFQNRPRTYSQRALLPKTAAPPQEPPQALENQLQILKKTRPRAIPPADIQLDHRCLCGHAPIGQNANKVSNLKRHKATCRKVVPNFHENKSHHCQCGKQYSRSDNLRVHQRKKKHEYIELEFPPP